MASKAPRRTAERILVSALGLFNRFGEPNVATTMVAADLGISPGNLYYHYPGKEDIVQHLFGAYQHDLQALLPAAQDVKDLEDAWFFLHSLFELVWRYRFLYRDLNDLLSKYRLLEQALKQVLADKHDAFLLLLNSLSDEGWLTQNPTERESTATQMLVILTWWLSYEYVRNPRHALEDAHAQGGVSRGAQQVLSLLLPYLEAQPKALLLALLQMYNASPSADAT
jgi:AcrR family transcriptional regulator